MWKFNETKEIYHFGIPGMKWGVRRNRTMSEIKRYSRLKKEKNIQNKKAEKARKNAEYNKKAAYKTIKKFGYARSNRGAKFARAITSGAAVYEGIASIHFMNQAAKNLDSGNKKKAGMYAAGAALTALAATGYNATNNDYKQRQSYYRDYEYNRLDKKYGKVIK